MFFDASGLWVTDGTAAGTAEVGTFPGAYATSGEIGIGDLTVFGNRLLFKGYDSTHGSELWVTDGTAAGTAMLADIDPGSASSNPYGFKVFGNRVLFQANDGVHGSELWVTDGTTAGTSLFGDVVAGSVGSYAHAVAVLLMRGKITGFSAGETTPMVRTQRWVCATSSVPV